MYARNNATPRPILIGTIVQISDGAVQTTGVLVKVSKDGGAYAAGANTPTVEEGEWSYTPSQGETDCESLRVILYKTGCYSRSQQVVFSASASFGHIGTDQSKIANASATQNLSGTSIKTATDVETKIDAIDDYIDTEVAAIKAKTDNLPSDPADASDIAASFATVNNNLSSIAGYIDTEVAAIKAKTDNLPANPAAVSDIPTANQNRDAVLNADPNAGYTDGSFGDRLLISDNNNRTVKVTGGGSGHIAADVHALQPAVINDTHFAAGAIDANALAADAATEIATAVGTLQVLTDLVTMIVNDGTANARWSTSALQNAPSGGGGSATVNVLPYTGAVPDRVEGTTIKVFYNELTNVSVGVTDATGAAVTLDAKTLRFCVEDRYGADVLTLNDGDITRSGSTFTVQIPQSLTDTVGANYRWSLRDLTGSLNTVLIHGQMIVAEAAEDEA